MIGGKSVLALIVARGGSVRLPGKNVMPFRGKPMIAWTVEAARGVSAIDRVVLSTDDPAIAEAARQAGCEVPFMRPAHLATSEASSVDVALHAVDALGGGHDLLVLLQPTSPFRAAEDIEGCLALSAANGFAPVVSVSKLPKAPNTLCRIHPETGILERPFPDAGGEVIHALNGAVYVLPVELLRRGRSFLPQGTLAYQMPYERSADIDTAMDLRIAEVMAP